MSRADGPYASACTNTGHTPRNLPTNTMLGEIYKPNCNQTHLEQYVKSQTTSSGNNHQTQGQPTLPNTPIQPTNPRNQTQDVDIAHKEINGLLDTLNILVRSEERRVGKECRSRWSPYH